MVITVLKRTIRIVHNAKVDNAKLIGRYFSDVVPRKGEVITGLDNEVYDVVEVIHNAKKTPGRSSVTIEVDYHNYYERSQCDTPLPLITRLERERK